VPVLSAGEIFEHPYLVMPFIDGVDLATFGAGEPSFERLVGVAKDAASALGYAHARGVLHRDVKVKNILVTRADRAMLIDFGLALVAGGERLTTTGVPTGTQSYLAPEYIEALDRKAAQHTELTDLWALGVVLYVATTHAYPFEASDPIALAAQIRAGSPPRVEELRPDAPRAWSELVHGLLARDPAQRVPSAQNLVERLERCLLEPTSSLSATPSIAVEVPQFALTLAALSAAPRGDADSFDESDVVDEGLEVSQLPLPGDELYSGEIDGFAASGSVDDESREGIEAVDDDAGGGEGDASDDPFDLPLEELIAQQRASIAFQEAERAARETSGSFDDDELDSGGGAQAGPSASATPREGFSFEGPLLELEVEARPLATVGAPASGTTSEIDPEERPSTERGLAGDASTARSRSAPTHVGVASSSESGETRDPLPPRSPPIDPPTPSRVALPSFAAPPPRVDGRRAALRSLLFPAALATTAGILGAVFFRSVSPSAPVVPGPPGATYVDPEALARERDAKRELEAIARLRAEQEKQRSVLPTVAAQATPGAPEVDPAQKPAPSDGEVLPRKESSTGATKAASERPTVSSASSKTAAAPPPIDDPYIKTYGPPAANGNTTSVMTPSTPAASTAAAESASAGTKVPVRVDAVVASSPPGPVIAVVTKKTKVGGLELPAGTQVHGETAGTSGERILVRFTFAVVGGKNVPLRGKALGPDNRAGLPANKSLGGGSDIAAKALEGAVRGLGDAAGKAIGGAAGDVVRGSAGTAAEKAKRLDQEELVLTTRRGLRFSIYVEGGP